MHIGFCNCARAVVHVALNILSVVDERDCLQFDNCVLHSSPRLLFNHCPALAPEFQGQRKNKRNEWGKKDLNIHDNSIRIKQLLFADC